MRNIDVIFFLMKLLKTFWHGRFADHGKEINQSTCYRTALVAIIARDFCCEKKNWHFETKVIPKCFSSEVWKIKFSIHCLFPFLFSDDEQTSGICPFASVNFFVFWLGNFKQQVIFFFALRDSNFSLLTPDCPVLNSSLSYIITHSIPTRIVTCH